VVVNEVILGTAGDQATAVRPFLWMSADVKDWNFGKVTWITLNHKV
jgi:hypothetical protein